MKEISATFSTLWWKTLFVQAAQWKEVSWRHGSLSVSCRNNAVRETHLSSSSRGAAHLSLHSRILIISSPSHRRRPPLLPPPPPSGLRLWLWAWCDRWAVRSVRAPPRPLRGKPIHRPFPSGPAAAAPASRVLLATFHFKHRWHAASLTSACPEVRKDAAYVHASMSLVRYKCLHVSHTHCCTCCQWKAFLLR